MVMLFKFVGLDTNMLLHPGMSIDKNEEKQLSQNCVKKLKDKFQKIFFDYLNKRGDYITSHNKLNLYCKIKKNFGFDKYLHLNNAKGRRSLSKIIISNHKLPIEVGRTDGTPKEKRFCKLCDDNKIGDESHVLFSNISLLNLRKKLISNLKEKNRDIEKLYFQSLFVYLVSCNDNDCNILLMKYVIDTLQIAK